MKIFVNGRFLTQRMTGVQRYALELVKHWDELLDRSEQVGGAEVTILAPPNRIYEPELKRIKLREIGGFGGHAWEQLVLPLHARGGHLINLCNTGPLLKRKQIVTIHDMAVFEHPESFSWLFRFAYRIIQRTVGRTSRRIVTISQFSKSQLMKHCRVSESKIDVISLGLEHMERLSPDRTILETHGFANKSYILAVGSMDPRKNFLNVAKAIELLSEADYDVVVAGGTNAKVFGTSPMPSSARLKWIGYVTDEQLKALYEGAACFVFPSVYEGFGLPPLEAMACGAPVIVARSSSLPEVCGEATEYCDPDNPTDIAACIERVMVDAELRERLTARGLERASRYRWDRCARETWEVVKEVALT
ncbi:glycosyltransferase family 4 protein [Cohnella sp. GCM10027633]|uniref:glycosyltransferase family 4 protein n=1 Tax=unclassified Cohnella TaxID=2636738 RepID=UPI00363AFFA4